MLFRQRVSLQGALHARQRVCGEMAAHNARADVHHEAQRYHASQMVILVLY